MSGESVAAILKTEIRCPIRFCREIRACALLFWPSSDFSDHPLYSRSAAVSAAQKHHRKAIGPALWLFLVGPETACHRFDTRHDAVTAYTTRMGNKAKAVAVDPPAALLCPSQ